LSIEHPRRITYDHDSHGRTITGRIHRLPSAELLDVAEENAIRLQVLRLTSPGFHGGRDVLRRRAIKEVIEDIDG
jgi:hypothetical protein